MDKTKKFMLKIAIALILINIAILIFVVRKTEPKDADIQKAAKEQLVDPISRTR